MNRSLLIVVLVLSAVCARAQESSQNQPAVLTLEQAVALAQANNRLVKNTQPATEISDDQVAEARTYRFPSVNFYALGSQLLTPIDFTFQKGAFGSFPGIGPVPPRDTNIHTPLKATFYGLVQAVQPLSQQY